MRAISSGPTTMLPAAPLVTTQMTTSWPSCAQRASVPHTVPQRRRDGPDCHEAHAASYPADVCKRFTWSLPLRVALSECNNLPVSRLRRAASEVASARRPPRACVLAKPPRANCLDERGHLHVVGVQAGALQPAHRLALLDHSSRLMPESREPTWAPPMRTVYSTEPFSHSTHSVMVNGYSGVCSALPSAKATTSP